MTAPTLLMSTRRRLAIALRTSRYWRGKTMPERVAVRYAYDSDAWAEQLVAAACLLERAMDEAISAIDAVLAGRDVGESDVA